MATELKGFRAANKERHILSRFWYERSVRKEFIQAPEGAERLPYVLRGIKTRFEYLFQGKEPEFNALIQEVASRVFTIDQEIIEVLTTEILEFARANFTREELEKRYGEIAYRGTDKIYLNELLDCNVDKKNPSELKVHLKATSGLGIKGVISGLHVLAGKLEHDKNLRSVEKIKVASYLVAERPQVFEKLGFILLDQNEEDEMIFNRRAEITKAEFVKKYGTAS